MVTPTQLAEVAQRSWDIADIVTVMDFNYSLFRLGLTDAETMNAIATWLWSLI